MLNLNNTIEQKQLNALIKNTNIGFFYGFLFIGILYFLIPEATSLNHYLSWALAYGLIMLLKFILVRQYELRDKIALVNIPKWLKAIDLLQLLTAISFCYLIIYYNANWPLVNQIIFWMVIISMVSGGIILYAMRLQTYLCFALPLIACSIYSTYSIQQDPYHLMSIMLVIYGFGVIKSAFAFKECIHELYIHQQKLAETNHRLESIASKDPLTRLPNRRSYDEYFASEWDRHKRSASILSLMIIDVDQFKEYNDHYGHNEGDTCLIRVGNIINNNLKRPGDMACRYGGEEFVVILPDTGYEGVIEVAERIRKAIHDLKIPHLTSDVCPFLTVSIGVSSIDPDDQNEPQDFFNHADSQLYIAKNTGRNKVCIDTESILRTELIEPS